MPIPVRVDFSEKIQHIRIGWTEREVLTTLGSPDSVMAVPQQSERQQIDSDSNSAISKEWHYGTIDHSSFGTLGHVSFDPTGSVVDVCGQDLPSHATTVASMLEEQELRRILTLIHTMPGCVGIQFNPIKAVAIVNAILSLSEKDIVVAVLHEYRRVVGFDRDIRSQYRLPPVARLVFEESVDSELQPRVPGGILPHPPQPTDPCILPYYPIAIINDVPLNVIVSVRPIASSGLSEWYPPLRLLAERLDLRQEKLQPVDSASIVESAFVATEFFQNRAWIQSDSVRSEVLSVVRKQLGLYSMGDVSE